MIIPTPHLSRPTDLLSMATKTRETRQTDKAKYTALGPQFGPTSGNYLDLMYGAVQSDGLGWLIVLPVGVARLAFLSVPGLGGELGGR